jgi:hypothetical protein
MASYCYAIHSSFLCIFKFVLSFIVINLQESATFESALDWLCLNLPGNELPLKFSSGTSFHYTEGVCISTSLDLFALSP